MKRLLLTTLISVFVCTSVAASSVILDYQGNTVVHQTSVERNLLINSDDDSVYNIAVKPLEDALRSIDGKVTIPLENLYLNNTIEDVYLRYNEYSNLFSNIQMGGVPKNLTAKIRDFGMVPAGTYNINFEIQATDVENGTIATMTTFNLQFIIPTVQEINLNGQNPMIKVGSANILKKESKIANETSPMVYINSNCDWELYIRPNEIETTLGDFYVRTLAASPNVTERIQERVLLVPGQEIVIAKGKAPSNNEYVTVEYSLENKDGKTLPAGKYENRMKYILREVR